MSELELTLLPTTLKKSFTLLTNLNGNYTHLTGYMAKIDTCHMCTYLFTIIYINQFKEGDTAQIHL